MEEETIEELLIAFHKEALHNYIKGNFELDPPVGLQELAEGYVDKIIGVVKEYKMWR